MSSVTPKGKPPKGFHALDSGLHIEFSMQTSQWFVDHHDSNNTTFDAEAQAKWDWAQNHPVYSALRLDPFLRAALAAFETGLSTTKVKHNPARLYFIGMLCILLCDFLKGGVGISKPATQRTRDKALAAVTKLRTAMDLGVRLKAMNETLHLRLMLNELYESLSQPSPQPNWNAQREIVETLAWGLHHYFGHAFTSALKHVTAHVAAALNEQPMDDSTIQRRIAFAKKKAGRSRQAPSTSQEFLEMERSYSLYVITRLLR